MSEQELREACRATIMALPDDPLDALTVVSRVVAVVACSTGHSKDCLLRNLAAMYDEAEAQGAASIFMTAANGPAS